MLKYLAYGPVAQGIEHRFPKPGVDGSNPPGVTIRQRAQRHCCPWVFSSPHGEAHSGCGTSPKGALCARAATQTAPLREAPGQTALFRRVRLSPTGQMRRRLTEKRTPQPGPHGKAHPARQTSRKGALWGLQNGQNASLREAGRCRMRFSVRLAGRMRFSVRRALGERAKVRFSVRSNVQNALFREGVVPDCAFP